MIELYAITCHPAPPLPRVPGLREVTSRHLSAVCSEAAADATTTAERLWEHEQMVERLMETRDLLPVRYGTRARDEAAVAHALDRRHDELTTALVFVRGAVEISVRVLGDGNDSTEQPGVRTRSGTDYLRTKARDASVRKAIARAVHEPLRALARADNTRPPTQNHELLRAAYLVDRGRVRRFTRTVEELETDHPGFRLLCTGPWPPYSFVER